MSDVTLQDIYAARRTLAPWVRRTPVVKSMTLSKRLNASVYLKLETVHDIGAFKIRGATNRILQLTKQERARGVVTVSTGNHGRAVAYAALQQGLQAVVCMSQRVPQNKVQAIRELGAEIRIIGQSQDDAEVEAKRLVVEEGRILVHPFDHPHVIAGQGTVGLELLEDLPDIDCVLVGLSGGGLISGIALALKAASPKIRIIAVSMKRGPAMYHSIKAGKPVPVEEESSLADSLGGGIGLENRYTFPLVQQYVDDIILVNEAQIADAMAYLYRNERLIAEGAASVGIAALLNGLVKPGRSTAIIITGNNVDMATFTDIMNGQYILE
jgi:threonine dehydratase